MSERELPMLAAIASFFHWIEEFLAICSGPLLVAGLGLALVDLLTDGRLLATQPELLFAWAIAMALGLDAQLVGTAAKLGRAVRTQHYWTAFFCTILVAALSYVAFLAAQVFATQEAHGWTTSQALAALGMDGTTWLVERSILSVVLVVLSGLLRYTPPGQATVIEERTKLERELELEPLRQRVRAGKALGATALARNMALAMAGKAPTEAPPTGPGTPQPALHPAPDIAPDTFAIDWEEQAQQPLRVMPRRMTAADQRAVRKRARMAGLRAAAFDALDHDPTMSRKALRSILNCAQTLANELYSAWVREHEREEVAQ